MTDAVPPEEPPTATVVSRIVSYSVAVLGGILIIVASYTGSNGDWSAPVSFRGLISVPMWVPFALGIAVLALGVMSLIGPVRVLARRAREKREPGRPD
ncbi:hypothetical protein G5T42_11845 [Microbacterium sp. 4R-513]|uniref:hypothetical protein n=1 Tax=Microbacterium sp. 4R-513 TaxID=2567934 RepID=UPI0013E1ED4D|nr:hypothetical protein [Microbacterium sp. 4R-513]QIG40089.1 hypothetical protein G5T42_11845 [Microbacterium sp. 4R-513]